ncbi:methyltransferase [Plectosphaerella cucumerina]|uniref:Methyltransferase n=1 Tax=Plectosphaerella cucumerina TaxID=40658 RepID=A0A8K0TMG8_9PEZI|nr:methyltransferase [Plectosphaerella cucumerina]
MAEQKKDNWSTEEYQNAAAFVPKLATKVVQWLDIQKDDRILDIGCGDGVLDVDFAHVLAEGEGSLHGVDSSAAMIETTNRVVGETKLKKFKFEVIDANALNAEALPKFNKAFSNAAMHWILKPKTAGAFFTTVRDVLEPGGSFVFEMGGLGNVKEMRTALIMATAGRIGIERALAVDPWFFPDEEWMRRTLEDEVGGWKVERIELEWRPTPTGDTGVEGWARLMGKVFFDAVREEKGDEAAEEAVREASEALQFVCDDGSGGQVISYVRLRCIARKV